MPAGSLEAMPWIRKRLGDSRADIVSIEWAGRNACDESLWSIVYKPSGEEVVNENTI